MTDTPSPISPDPIEDRFLATMNVLAQTLDEVFNGSLRGEQRRVGFVLVVSEFHRVSGRVNYISNGNRADMTAMLTELLARFKGQPLEPGHA